MKIVELKAENIKRIVAVEIRPDGNMVEITGKNAAGKSSVLDAIFWALAGVRSHQREPIRRGQDTARITLNLGEIVVKREFKRVKRKIEGQEDAEEQITTRIVVQTGDGARYPSPQTMLDSLLDTLSFDPLQFARMDAKSQYEALKTLVGLDFSALNKRGTDAYNERTQINRRVKEKRAAAEQIVILDDAPSELVDVSRLVSNLQEAERENAAIAEQERELERRRAAASEAKTRLEIASQEEEGAERALREAVERRQAIAEEVAEALEGVESFPEIPTRNDLAPIQEEIAGAESKNAAYRATVEREKLIGEAKQLEEASAKCTKTIDDAKAEAARLVEKADMPVPGLSLKDGAVILNDLPLEQASDAEQLRVSCAIAMRSKSKLRVIRVRDGSLLDEDSLAILRKMAEEEDCQIWIERVDTSGMGFFIEEGRVRPGPEGGLFDQDSA